MTHELSTFMQQDLAEMTSEYARIRARTLEDPGTAGDEGEEAWAAVLRAWLPQSYQVEVKGRILAADGSAGPQVDLVILKPGYPDRLRKKKLFIAGGVAAAFECKNTLKASHIRSAFQTAAWIDSVKPETAETPHASPFTELVPHIYFGLLAHGHSWVDQTRALEHIIEVLREQIDGLEQPRQCLSVLALADSATIETFRISFLRPSQFPPEMPRGPWAATPPGSPEEDVMTLLMSLGKQSSKNLDPANPLGVLVRHLVGRLAHEDTMLRSISEYFAAAGLAGGMGEVVAQRAFKVSEVYPDRVRAQLPHALVGGGMANNWSVAFHF